MTTERTLATQLFSCSFRDKVRIIYDRKSCEVADWLLRLDDVGYDKEHIRNITINGEHLFTYLPKGRDCVLNDAGTAWVADGRQQGKIGKIVRKLDGFADQGFTDQQLEKFVNYVKAIDEGGLDDFTFKVVSGSAILDVYACRNKYTLDTEVNIHTLGGSCMNGKPSDYFEIYEDTVEMLVLLRNDQSMVGRALLWETTSGLKIMDRIYGSDNTIEKFANWAMDNGYYRKRYQSYDEFESWVSPEGNGENHTFKIAISNDDYSYYPYMDTFSFRYDGYHSNSNDCGSCTGEARSTGGDILGSHYCEGCGNSSDDELNYIEDLQEDRCSDCAIYDDYNGRWIDRDDSIYIDTRNSGNYGVCVHQSDATYSDMEGADILNDECVYTDEGDILSDNAIELHDGEYLHTSSDRLVYLENGEYTDSDYEDTVTTIYDEVYLEDECVELTEGGWILEGEAVETHNGNIEVAGLCTKMYNGEWALDTDVEKTDSGYYVLEDDVAVCDYTNQTYHCIDEMYTLPDGSVCIEEHLAMAWIALGYTKVNGVWLSPKDLENVGLTTKIGLVA